MKVPPRVRRAFEEETRFWPDEVTLVGWAQTHGYYIAVYDIGPRPISEETEASYRRWFVFDKSGRIYYSGMGETTYGWRKNSDGD